MAFDFYSKKAGMALTKSGGTVRIPHDLDGVHRLRLHPMHTPSARMSWLFRARTVPHAAIGAVITDMRPSASSIPVKKETRPTVVVHRFRGARWWHSNFEHAYKFIFENHLVTIRGSLHGIEAVGKARFVLSIGVKIPAEHRERTRDEQGNPHELSGAKKTFRLVHDAEVY